MRKWGIMSHVADSTTLHFYTSEMETLSLPYFQQQTNNNNNISIPVHVLQKSVTVWCPSLRCVQSLAYSPLQCLPTGQYILEKYLVTLRNVHGCVFSPTLCKFLLEFNNIIKHRDHRSKIHKYTVNIPNMSMSTIIIPRQTCHCWWQSAGWWLLTLCIRLPFRYTLSLAWDRILVPIHVAFLQSWLPTCE